MTTQEFEACSRAFREWMVELWNRTCPPGTPVMACPKVFAPFLEEYPPFETRTTCPAELSFGYPVVKVEGYHGFVDLDYCLPLGEEVAGRGAGGGGGG